MTSLTGGVLWGLLALGGPSFVPETPADTLTGPGSAVPFVAQTPLLCGGAAAAMIQRYHGARGVHGDDYRHLVRVEEGGIRTSELASAMASRGYRVTVSRSDPDAVFRALRAGVPSILLLAGGNPALHYVVLVGVEGTTVRFHDPNFGPMRRAPLDDFLDRWGASGYWALLAVPEEPAGTQPGTSGDGKAAEPEEEVEAAEELSPRSDSAMDLLRAGRYEAARDAAASLVEADPTDRTARRILATAHYLNGEPERALTDWNALGEPRVDLVRIGGLQHTRYHAAADRVGIEPGALLTPGGLALARRRLAQLPAIAASRVDYQPLPDGQVEVQAAVLERRRWPGSLVLGTRALAAAVNRVVWMEAGPFMGAGDVWRAGGGWGDAQRFVTADVASPAPPVPGVVRMGTDWRSERFEDSSAEGGLQGGAAVEWSRVRASLGMEEWVGGDTRLGGGVALERWEDEGRMVSGALMARHVLAEDAVVLDGHLEGWTGDMPSFGRWQLSAEVDVVRGRNRAWRVRGTGAGVMGPAPELIWPGAGTGRLRAPLLRGHPLERDGLIAGKGLGRRLLQGTVEHRLFRRVGPVRAGGFVFLDAAMVWETPPDGAERTLADPGLGLFLDTGSRELSVSLARGGSDWVVSVRLEAGH